MAEQANGEQGWVYRDRDPPPAYRGENPSATFRGYLRDLELWQAASDVPVEKQGLKLVQVLSGPAKSAVDVLKVEEIKGADGFKNVVRKLKEAFEPYVETALPRAMEQAFFGAPRSHKESIAEFLVRFQKAHNTLKDEGLELPVKATGYLLFKQANLDPDMEARLTTWLAGDYSKDVVIANLRRLERVVTEQTGKKAYGAEASEAEVYDEEWQEDSENQVFYEADLDDGEDDEQYVYLEDGDLGAIIEEDAMMEALASYQETRQRLREQQKGRQFYRPKGLRAKEKAAARASPPARALDTRTTARARAILLAHAGCT